jgi:hypothetical protein
MLLVDGVDLDDPDLPPGFKDTYLAAVAEDQRREAAERDPWLMRRAAHWYVQQLHWPVFPIAPGTKEPATKHGFKDASLDIERVNRWWPEGSQRGIGTPTGRTFDVIDVDWYRSCEGWHALRDQIPPALARSLTGGGGIHLLIAPDPALRCGTDVWPGIDIRAAGGYVVLPPTRHPTGQRYRWDINPGADLAGR